ncbi:hypothetical protein BC936DRAFT_143933 [Jimgerdemannia flammicorona]|uniref:Uncharacterized protein n=2 Tax=Jimgerdemannia flammicorona TaxID=994334 RepID=A0A433DDC0_9FUNG|nr:hypothetical protein BC936DRAFT_143933 [Jimgerdemannia flammicorona]RUS29994.1 hypothetical protein BC938DRAFT_479977 [Jimgerdemannia flammicorona]
MFPHPRSQIRIMTDETFTEAHGFVQFDFAFDDEDLFAEEKASRVSQQQYYEAKREYGGVTNHSTLLASTSHPPFRQHGTNPLFSFFFCQWFNSVKPVSTIMLDRSGPNELKSSIEYHYLHGRHAHALTLALQYIHYVEQNRGQTRVQSAREMLEIAARCSIRVGDIPTAVTCVEKIESNEPGLWLFRGEVYEAAGRFADSIRSYIRYNLLRKSDYNVWKHMGTTLFSASLSTTSLPLPNLSTHLAHLCLLRAHTIMNLSRWADIPFVQRRFRHELGEVEVAIRRVEEAGGNLEKALAWWAEYQDVEVNGSGSDEELVGGNLFIGWESAGGIDLQSVRWIVPSVLFSPIDAVVDDLAVIQRHMLVDQLRVTLHRLVIHRRLGHQP